eukprot:scaffold104115_cov67-Phaeocystis_antarctica.AAC.7
MVAEPWAAVVEKVGHGRQTAAIGKESHLARDFNARAAPCTIRASDALRRRRQPALLAKGTLGAGRGHRRSQWAERPGSTQEGLHRARGRAEVTLGARAGTPSAHLTSPVSRPHHATRTVEWIVLFQRRLGQDLDDAADELRRLSPVARLQRHRSDNEWLQYGVGDSLEVCGTRLRPGQTLWAGTSRHRRSPVFESRASRTVDSAEGACDPPARWRWQLEHDLGACNCEHSAGP